MKLESKTYDILAYIGRTALPALSVLVLALGKVWNPEGQLAVLLSGTIMALDVFLNTLLGESKANYYKELNESEDVSGDK